MIAPRDTVELEKACLLSNARPWEGKGRPVFTMLNVQVTIALGQAAPERFQLHLQLQRLPVPWVMIAEMVCIVESTLTILT